MASGDYSVARWRLFGGGDVYDPNAWATRGTVRRVANGEIVTGPRGTFLFEHEPLASQRLRPFQAPFSFRSFDARRARFRPARTAGADRSVFGSSTAIQDARGRLHIVADTASAGAWNCVLYARTGTRSRSWFGKTTVLFRSRDNARKPNGVRLGAAPDGRGVAVWQDGPTSGSRRCGRHAGSTARGPTRTTGRPAPATAMAEAAVELRSDDRGGAAGMCCLDSGWGGGDVPSV